MTVKTLEEKRKRLIFRSWHRGTREMDLIMGRFADRHVPDFTDQELDLYEEVLQNPDPDLYDWISGRIEVPANLNNPIIEKLLQHHHVTGGDTRDGEHSA